PRSTVSSRSRMAGSTRRWVPRSYWVKEMERCSTIKRGGMDKPPCSLMDGGRVQNTAEPVPQQGKEGDRSHQGQAREEGQPPLAGGEIAHAFRENDADGGLLW